MKGHVRYYSPVGRGVALLRTQGSISYVQSDEETYDMNDETDTRMNYADDKDARIAELQQWVRDLQSGMHLNCVYCGWRAEPSTSEALHAHILTCEKHPAHVLQSRIAELEAFIAARTLVHHADADAYCEIVRMLGMEEEGDPIVEVLRLVNLEREYINQRAGRLPPT